MSPRLRGPAQVPASSTTNPHYSNSLQTPCPNFHVDQSRRKNCASTAARRRTRPLTDRALIEALRRIDARIRHDPAICVAVSGRITGRAAGGMAETIRRRMVRQDEFTDASLEPAEDAVRRADFRQRTRMVRAGQSVDPDLAADLPGSRGRSADFARRSAQSPGSAVFRRRLGANRAEQSHASSPPCALRRLAAAY
jgi:hypothetical protein